MIRETLRDVVERHPETMKVFRCYVMVDISSFGYVFDKTEFVRKMRELIGRLKEQRKRGWRIPLRSKNCFMLEFPKNDVETRSRILQLLNNLKVQRDPSVEEWRVKGVL